MAPVVWRLSYPDREGFRIKPWECPASCHAEHSIVVMWQWSVMGWSRTPVFVTFQFFSYIPERVLQMSDAMDVAVRLYAMIADQRPTRIGNNESDVGTETLVDVEAL